MTEKLEQLLIAIGLSENEALVMIVLLSDDFMKVSNIAKLAKLNRTTTYGIVKSLMKRGLITSIQQYGITQYRAIEIEQLPSYIERQQKQLQNKKRELKKLLPEIKKQKNKNPNIPSVKFFEGIKGIKQAYEDTLFNNTEKTIYVFSSPDAVLETLGNEYANYYMQKRKQLGICCKQIAAKSKTSEIVQTLDKSILRTTHLIPKEFDFETEIVIYDDKTTILSFSKDKPIATIIDDEAISNTLKKLFLYIESKIDNE